MKPFDFTDEQKKLSDALVICNDCPVAKKCGGCSYAGRTYLEQALGKEEMVRELLSPFCETLQIHLCDTPLYYRNKVHSQFKKLKNGRVIVGPYEANSHRIVEVDSCLIENQTASKIIRDAAKLAERLKIDVFDETRRTGDLRRILVRTADNTGEIMVVLIIGNKIFKKKKLYTDELIRLHPEITTLLINVNTRQDSMILGNGETKTVKGKGYITDIVLGKKYRVSPDSFMQSNLKQAEVLYSQAVMLADFNGTETAIDTYCGTGSTTLSFADFVGNITGVEIKESAYQDALKNAAVNKVKNAQFVQGDATVYMDNLSKTDTKIDVVMLDPTRAGTTDVFIRACARLAPPKIVYISCCPETLARDLKKFREYGYEAKIAKPVDMFPWTEKVETVVILIRCV